MSNKVKKIIDGMLSLAICSLLIYLFSKSFIFLLYERNVFASVAVICVGVILIITIMITISILMGYGGFFLKIIKRDYIVLKSGRPQQIAETELCFWKFFKSKLTSEKYNKMIVDDLVSEVAFLTDSGQLIILKCTIFITLNEFLSEKNIESLNERWRMFNQYSGDIETPDDIKYHFNEFKRWKAEDLKNFYNSASPTQQETFSCLVTEYLNQRILDSYRVSGAKFDLKNITIFNKSNN